MRSRTDMHAYQVRAVDFIIKRKRCGLFVDMGLGKQQPDSEPVLTPSGWRAIGDLAVGDSVIGANGRPTLVTGVFPQGVHEVVKVAFNDGSWCNVGWEHLWRVQSDTMAHRGDIGRVMTTRQIADGGFTRKGFIRWRVPLTEPVQFDHADLQVDPYTLGVVLGDGTIGSSVTVCTDIEIILACGMKFLRSHKTSGYTAYGSLPGLARVMSSLGLVKTRSWEKFVPAAYLMASPEQRLALLQGLLDTDGGPIDKGGVEFSSTSEQLADDVVSLAQSLGGIGRKTGPRITRHQNGEGRPSWRVNVKLPSHMNPFRLARKLDKWIRPAKYPVIRKMISAEVVGTESSTCIMVAADDHLYLTRNYIVTHNTVSTLTAIKDLLDACAIKRVLVVAPLRVARSVWPDEIAEWSHLTGLSVSVCLGNEKQRLAGLAKTADIYTINRENVAWLVKKANGKWPFDMVVIDESSSFKSPSSQRFRALKKVFDLSQYMILLTGSPAPNGLLDVWSQYFLIDGGMALGRTYTGYKTRFFEQDYNGYNWLPKPGAAKLIHKAMSYRVLSMQAEDYLELPDRIDITVPVSLPEHTAADYDEFEKHLIIELEDDTIEALSAGVLANKLLQWCNGFVYTEDGAWIETHDAKLDAMEDILEDAGDEPVMVAYNYKVDLERIKRRFPHATVMDKNPDTITRWNARKIKLLLIHPASAGHGLNLQKGSNILIWFGLNWSLELYEQTCARLHRQGQTRPVRVYHIVVKGCLDERVMRVLAQKDKVQSSLLSALQYTHVKTL